MLGHEEWQNNQQNQSKFYPSERFFLHEVVHTLPERILGSLELALRVHSHDFSLNITPLPLTFSQEEIATSTSLFFTECFHHHPHKEIQNQEITDDDQENEIESYPDLVISLRLISNAGCVYSSEHQIYPP